MSNGSTNTYNFEGVGAFGIKKRNFTAQTAIPSDATLDFVYNGSNIKITYTDIVAGLSVTGSIVSTTESGTTPVLDQAGSVNTIRALKEGTGIGLAVTGEGSIEISTSFTVDTTGAPVFNTATTPTTVRSLTAGDGITIGFDANTIQVSATGGAGVAGKTIQINSMSDFPDPVGGVITLSDDTFYSVNNDLSTSNRFVLGDQTKVGSVGSSIITLTYTGTATLFTSVDGSNTLSGMTIDCSLGTLLDWSDTVGNTHRLSLFDVNVTCNSIGTHDNGRVLFVEDSVFICTTDGITMSNVVTTDNILMTTSSFVMTAGTALDLGTAVFASVRLQTVQFSLSLGSTGISGTTASGNIDNLGGLGRLDGLTFFGTGTPLNNISSADDLWYMSGNYPIKNTRSDGLVSMNTNAVETVIVAANTPVKVAGLWTVEIESQFTATTDGRLTYTGATPQNMPIAASIRLNQVGPGADTLAAYYSINGTIVGSSESPIVDAAVNEHTIPVAWQHAFEPNDYVEIWVENQTDTSNIIADKAVFRVN